MKKFYFLVMLFSILNASSNPVGVKFPTIKGISLSEKSVTFPDDLNNRVTVLSVAFKQQAQYCINSWADEFLKKYGLNQSVLYYEIPMLGAQWKMARNWIDGGMRGGVPKPLHDFTVTYYGPLKKYYKSLGINDKSDCYIYILDKEGVVQGYFQGYSKPETIKDFFKLIDSLNDQ
jgi:hypothetical protein